MHGLPWRPHRCLAGVLDSRLGQMPSVIRLGFRSTCERRQGNTTSDTLRLTVGCETLVFVRLRRYSGSPLKKKPRRGFRGYPIATIAFYGPDDARASKAAVAIVKAEGAEPSALHRWFTEGATSGQIRLLRARSSSLVRDHGAKSVVITDRIIGCPHEEPIPSYPEGQVCPQCPSWAHRDRWTDDLVQ